MVYSGLEDKCIEYIVFRTNLDNVFVAISSAGENPEFILVAMGLDIICKAYHDEILDNDQFISFISTLNNQYTL
jgi:hypothetical protein